MEIRTDLGIPLKSPSIVSWIYYIILFWFCNYIFMQFLKKEQKNIEKNFFYATTAVAKRTAVVLRTCKEGKGRKTVITYNLSRNACMSFLIPTLPICDCPKLHHNCKFLHSLILYNYVVIWKSRTLPRIRNKSGFRLRCK